MVKIWEVTFTSFSGSTEVAYDEVGTQHLTSYSNISKVSPLSEFNYRGGISFTTAGVVQSYHLTSGVVTNAYSAGPWTQRSFVLWGYFPATTDDSLWDGSADCSIWGNYQAPGSSTAEDGFHRRGNTGEKEFVLRLNAATTFRSFSGTNQGWHLLVATIDKAMPRSCFYLDAQLVNSGTTIASTTTNAQLIGERNAGTEGTYQLGYVATYDHILSQSEINAIYNTFLVDSAVSSPYQAISGVIYSLSGTLQSGSNVFAIYEPTKTVVDDYTTSGDGYYYLNLPYSGAYTIVSTNSPNAGSRATVVTATSSGVFPVI